MFLGQPLVGSLLAALFLQDRLSGWFFAGSALTVSGILLAQLGRPDEVDTSAPSVGTGLATAEPGGRAQRSDGTVNRP